MADDCEGIPSCCDENWFQYQACCPVPMVDAGQSQEVEIGDGVSFSGVASDYQTVQWSQISGPEVTIQNPSTLTASVSSFENDGTYVFRLTGFNACGSEFSDVTVTVNAPSAVFSVGSLSNVTTPAYGGATSEISPPSFSLLNQTTYGPVAYVLKSETLVPEGTGSGFAGLVDSWVIGVTGIVTMELVTHALTVSIGSDGAGDQSASLQVYIESTLHGVLYDESIFADSPGTWNLPPLPASIQVAEGETVMITTAVFNQSDFGSTASIYVECRFTKTVSPS